MGSGANVPQLYIAEFRGRLIELARHRVHSGEFSERGLARLAGISQPHLHNVFKGIRTLSPDAADRLMQALAVTIPQVLWSVGGNDDSGVMAVPLLRHRIGPGITASFDAYRGYMPFPNRLITPLKQPVAAYLAADLVLPSEYRTGDMVLLDQNPARRIMPGASSCWIVAESAGLRVRYVRRTRGGLEVASDPGLEGVRGGRLISLRGSDILEIVRARIVWIGREMEAQPAGPHGTARAGD